VTTWFFAFAALMLLAALAFVLPTLLRGRARAAGVIVALLLPLAAVLLYRHVGNPDALQPDAANSPQQKMDQALVGLAAKLRQNPDDVDGWSLLGRAYEAMQRFPDARDALAHAHALAPDNADVTVAYAEALALATDSRRIEGEPRALIEDVLKKAPDHERGLWLLGIGDYQQRRYDAAIANWKHLLEVLPKDSDIVPSVQQQIAQAQAARDGKPGDTKPAAKLRVEVALDAKLRDKLGADDVVFVYAKAAAGPPMPLAVQRVPASKLPLTVTLTDGMGMLPNMSLSQFPQVIVGARVSKSGDAIARSGDLQTQSTPLDVSTTTPIKLTIDQIVP
jgi:cytochrome c-type biogenesis protein CcmH